MYQVCGCALLQNGVLPEGVTPLGRASSQAPHFDDALQVCIYTNCV